MSPLLDTCSSSVHISKFAWKIPDRTRTFVRPAVCSEHLIKQPNFGIRLDIFVHHDGHHDRIGNDGVIDSRHQIIQGLEIVNQDTIEEHVVEVVKPAKKRKCKKN